MKKNPDDFDITDYIVEDDRLSPFEEALMDAIKEWEKEGIDPRRDINTFREYANELYAVALNPIPCWNKIEGPARFENGLVHALNGTALVHDGYFVMVKDLVERLPRLLGEESVARWHSKREAIKILDEETDLSWFGNLFTYLRKIGELDGLCKLDGRRWLYDTNGIIAKYKEGRLNYHQKR